MFGGRPTGRLLLRNSPTPSTWGTPSPSNRPGGCALPGPPFPLFLRLPRTSRCGATAEDYPDRDSVQRPRRRRLPRTTSPLADVRPDLGGGAGPAVEAVFGPLMRRICAARQQHFARSWTVAAQGPLRAAARRRHGGTGTLRPIHEKSSCLLSTSASPVRCTVDGAGPLPSANSQRDSGSVGLRDSGRWVTGHVDAVVLDFVEPANMQFCSDADSS
jgi:hypothetical protein